MPALASLVEKIGPMHLKYPQIPYKRQKAEWESPRNSGHRCLKHLHIPPWNLKVGGMVPINTCLPGREDFIHAQNKIQAKLVFT
eukprot:c29509_g1_i1 orf=557-808(+)